MNKTAWKERLKGFGWRRWLLLVLNAVLVLACAACAVGLHMVSTTLDTSAARRFRGESDTRFAQVACFLPVGRGKTAEEIRSFRQELEAKFEEQSLEAPENGSLYVDAYSGTGQVSVTTDHGTADLTAFGVGGDFFYFHPLTLRSGSYIAERDLMDDLVVLDEVLAWRLFGGVDLAGLTVTINGQPFVVSGVVAMEEDFASQRATGDQQGCIFLSWSALKRLDDTLDISCYELVMPDPITGYAKGVAEESFATGDVVENSSRYTASHLLEVIGSFGERSMRADGIIYPYWENALRLTEDYAALLLVLLLLLALCPVISALVLGIRWIWRSGRRVKAAVPERVEAAVERRREKRYEEFLDKDAEGDETWRS